MQRASEQMRYEEAARLRDQIQAISETVEKQKVVEAGGGDQDVVGLHREGGEVEIVLMFIREGKLIGRRSFPLEWRLDEDELLGAFLKQYYSRDVVVPDQILVPFAPDDTDSLTVWLSEKRGRKVHILAPQRGDKVRLVEMAARNAEQSFRERGSRREARREVLEEIGQRLHLSRIPRRMECFDISHVQGSQTVGSMVVVLDGEPAPSEYRRFKIATVEGNDDFASMREVLARRLRRGIKEGELPDFILIDGGKGQLAVVVMVLEELDLLGRIDVAGMAKSRVISNMKGRAVERSEERFFLPGRKNAVMLRQGSAALFMLERLRDEAHRFAISYHRNLRGKNALSSVLEAIPGVGAARRKLLLKYFGSVKNIRAASREELAAVEGVPAGIADAVYQYFHEDGHS
jgi:excinuclease ABC subunit C